MREGVKVSLRLARSGAWEGGCALLWTPPRIDMLEGIQMAEEEEPLLASPGSPEMTAHVHDYDRFTRMMKYGALVCLVVGLFVLLILK